MEPFRRPAIPVVHKRCTLYFLQQLGAFEQILVIYFSVAVRDKQQEAGIKFNASPQISVREYVFFVFSDLKNVTF